MKHKQVYIRSLKLLARIFTWLALSLLALLIIIIVLVNIPAIQTAIVSKASRMIADKTGSAITIGSIKIAFPKTIVLKEIFLEDQQQDTLLFLGLLRVNIDLIRLLRQEVRIETLQLANTKLLLKKEEGQNVFNYQFIIDSLTSGNDAPKIETTQEPSNWTVSVSNIGLENVKVFYLDFDEGQKFNVDIGELNIRLKNIDIDDLSFDIRDILIRNSSIMAETWIRSFDEPVISDQAKDPDVKTALPEIKLGKLKLENVKLHYAEPDIGNVYAIQLANFVFEPNRIDLNAQTLDLGTLAVSDSKIDIIMLSQAADESVSTATSEPFSIFPDWHIKMSKLALNNIELNYKADNDSLTQQGFNPNDIRLSNLNIALDDVNITPDQAGLNLHGFSFSDHSGFDLNNLELNLLADNYSIQLNNLLAQAGKSRLEANAGIQFKSFETLLNEPGKIGIDLEIGKSNLFINDLSLFVSDDFIGQFRDQSLTIDLAAEGFINALKINKLNLSIPGMQTSMSAHAILHGLPAIDKLAYELIIDSFISGSDMIQLLTEGALDDWILPEMFNIALQAAGTADSVNAQVNFGSDLGNLFAEAFYQVYENQLDTFHLKVSIDSLRLGTFAAMDNLGSLTGSFSAFGTGLAMDTLSVDADFIIDELFFNDYLYKNIVLNSGFHNNILAGHLIFSDPNLEGQVHFTSGFEASKQTFSVNLDLKNIDLRKLGFAADDFKTSTRIAAKGHYASLDDMAVSLTVTDTKALFESLLVPVDTIQADILLSEQSSTFDLSSEFGEIKLASNASLTETGQMLQTAWKKYIGLGDTLELQTGKTIYFSIGLSYHENAFLRSLLDLKDIEITNFSGVYHSSDNSINATMGVPLLNWQDIILHDFHLIATGLQDQLSITAAFDRITFDTLSFGNFSLTAMSAGGNITTAIRIHEHEGQAAYFLNNSVRIEPETMRISFLPEGLIINHEHWAIPSDNSLEINSDGFIAHNFSFSNQDQRISVETPDSALVFRTENFNLNDLFNLINIGEAKPMISGLLDSEFIFAGEDDQGSLYASLAIHDLFVIDILLGNLYLTTELVGQMISFDINLQDVSNALRISGTIDQSDDEPVFDITGKFNLTNLEQFEYLTLGYLSQLSGGIFGEVAVKGTTSNPSLIGSLNFKQTSFKVPYLNFLLLLKDEHIAFNKNGIQIKDFVIRDEENRELKLNGSVITNNYSDFSFDLQMKTDRFRFVNSTREENAQLFGKLYLGYDIHLTGTDKLPVIQANILIDQGTDLTYVLPGSETELITAEGVVRFVTPQDSIDSELVKPVDYLVDSLMSAFRGVDLAANLRLHPNAKFTVWIDPVSGNYLTISGEAFLNFNQDMQGNQTLTGVFEVKEGKYEISFYGLVNRSFSFEPGSNISWSGEVMDAKLNITASHVVRTSSEALMANESTGLTANEGRLFRQRLPYEVLLNIRGFLSDPTVSFNIRLPDRYMAENPQIAAKLNMLNSEHNESELNKQVFSLLFLGSFIPQSTSANVMGSAASMATTTALNSVNGILTQQLNNLSSRYLRHVDVRFNLESYADYFGASNDIRTELDVQVSRSFFNERLTIEAIGTFDFGAENKSYLGQSSQSMHGEYSIIYDLTPGGQYRLKAFHENTYHVLDGEITNSGIAFIIQKNFDTWQRKKAGTQNKEEEIITTEDD